MNAVSFTVFGTSGVYGAGLLENLRRLPEVYPGWQPVVYTDGAQGSDWLTKCRKLGAVVEMRPCRPDTGGMFWRFEAVGDARWDTVIVRDTDSVVSVREAGAVEEWLQLPATLHAMHDERSHWDSEYPVLGGMWGARQGALRFDFPHLVRWWVQHKGPFQYNADQWFLKRFVWPHLLRSGVIHTGEVNSRYRGRPFPPHAPVGWHVGERLTPGRWEGHTARATKQSPTPPPLPHGFAA